MSKTEHQITVRIAYRERGDSVSRPEVLDCIGFVLGLSTLDTSEIDPSMIEIIGLKSTGALDSTTHVAREPRVANHARMATAINAAIEKFGDDPTAIASSVEAELGLIASPEVPAVPHDDALPEKGPRRDRPGRVRPERGRPERGQSGRARHHPPEGTE